MFNKCRIFEQLPNLFKYKKFTAVALQNSLASNALPECSFLFCLMIVWAGEWTKLITKIPSRPIFYASFFMFFSGNNITIKF